MFEMISLVLSPAQTNTYLVADPETKEAAVIDPAWDGSIILKAARERGWRIAHLWYTHAHFDHIGGAAEVADALNPLPLVALHPDDHVLWRSGGGGAGTCEELASCWVGEELRQFIYAVVNMRQPSELAYITQSSRPHRCRQRSHQQGACLLRVSLSSIRLWQA